MPELILPSHSEIEHIDNFSDWLYNQLEHSVPFNFTKFGRFLCSWRYYFEFCGRFSLNRIAARDIAIGWIARGQVTRCSFKGFYIKTSGMKNVR